MKLECFKYKENMQAEDAVCRHLGDYCKYRTSCVIHFMSIENKTMKKKIDKGDNPSQREKNGCEK